MTTYTIVSKDTDPLGPNEIAAGDTILVSDGDIYIIDASADSNVTFEASGEGSMAFEVEFNEPVTVGFDITVEAGLNPTFTIADNLDLSEMRIDARHAESVDLIAGNSVSFGQFDGSVIGNDTIVIGDDFSTPKNWNLGDGDNDLTVGQNAVFEDIDTGDGADVLNLGDGATVNNVNTGEGEDDLTFGDDLTAHDIKSDKGNDTLRIGDNATVNKVDGGSETDVLYTQTTGLDIAYVETVNIVCFVKGTRIETRNGLVPVERLHAGDLVRTVDRGFQPLRWVGCTVLNSDTLAKAPRLRPIRITAGALGPGLPETVLRVSPQHRILMRSVIAERMFGASEVFLPARKLTSVPGIRAEVEATHVDYYHLLFDHHEVLFSEGAETESLFLGPQALNALDDDMRTQIRRTMPKAFETNSAKPLARPSPQKGRQIARFLDRHQKNGKALVAPAVPHALLKAY